MNCLFETVIEEYYRTARRLSNDTEIIINNALEYLATKVELGNNVFYSINKTIVLEKSVEGVVYYSNCSLDVIWDL